MGACRDGSHRATFMSLLSEGASMPDETLIAEKVEQARDVVADADADAWLTFARETGDSPEPCLPYLLGFDVVWPSMVLVTPADSTVILGRHDAPNAESLGVHEVVGYDEGLAEHFGDWLDRVDPDAVAVNYDRDDPVADGLTHGLYLRLRELLDDADTEVELTSASPIIDRFRGQKTETERQRVQAAADETVAFFDDLQAAWGPEWTEADVSEYFHDKLDDAGYGSAWSWDYCPTVHAGGDAPVGHTLPGDRTVPPGEVLHVDFGVVKDGYAADLQRLFYRPVDGEEPPADLRDAFEDVRAAIRAGHEALEPGVAGHVVDTAARQELTSRDWPAYEHAFGHQVGRNAHDGGTLLGPRWDRYGEAPKGEVRPGEIYTMELGVDTEWGYLGQEEMVRITHDGTEFVVEPQTALRTLQS
jgi:Xaa-Pro aminopeptidase